MAWGAVPLAGSGLCCSLWPVLVLCAPSRGQRVGREPGCGVDRPLVL